MSDATYPVFETFHSWQGEGEHVGRSAFFIRLYGCPIRCPWCDSAATWQNSPEILRKIRHATAAELTTVAAATKPDFVVITGGEPTIHDLAPLCDALHAAKLRVHLETSGAFEICGNVDWVTLSPKTKKLPLRNNLTRADELKLIIGDKADLFFWAKEIAGCTARSVWLHPEWSQRENPDVLAAISAWVRDNGSPYRAGWQLHKLYGAE